MMGSYDYPSGRCFSVAFSFFFLRKQLHFLNQCIHQLMDRRLPDQFPFLEENTLTLSTNPMTPS
jgi:hypothetical protein